MKKKEQERKKRRPRVTCNHHHFVPLNSKYVTGRYIYKKIYCKIFTSKIKMKNFIILIFLILYESYLHTVILREKK